MIRFCLSLLFLGQCSFFYSPKVLEKIPSELTDPNLPRFWVSKHSSECQKYQTEFPFSLRCEFVWKVQNPYPSLEIFVPKVQSAYKISTKRPDSEGREAQADGFFSRNKQGFQGTARSVSFSLAHPGKYELLWEIQDLFSHKPQFPRGIWGGDSEKIQTFQKAYFTESILFLGIFLFLCYLHSIKFVFGGEPIHFCISLFCSGLILLLVGYDFSETLASLFGNAGIVLGERLQSISLLFLIISLFLGSLVFLKKDLPRKFRIPLVGIFVLIFLWFCLSPLYFQNLPFLIAAGLLGSFVALFLISYIVSLGISFGVFLFQGIPTTLVFLFFFGDIWQIWSSGQGNHLFCYAFLFFWVPFFGKLKKEEGKRERERNALFESRSREFLEKSKALETEKNKADTANEIKDKLISIVSHDIRSPLSGISSVLDLLVHKPEDLTPENAKQILGEASQGIKHILLMLEDIVKYSRFQNSQNLPAYQLFDFHSVLSKSLEKVEKQRKEKNVKIDFLVEEQSIAIGDPDLVEQLAINLLSNAIKFSYPFQTISLQLTEQNQLWRLDVLDQGMGFPSEWEELLVESGFLYVRRGTKGEIGPGVGLTFSNSIAELHSASLIAKGTEEKGAHFSFLLPNYSCIVLLLDDQAYFRKRTKKLLQDLPVIVWEEESPLQALGRMHSLKPDLILTDFQMPQMNGLEFLSKVYQNTDWSDVFSIMFSSQNLTKEEEASFREKARTIGVEEYFSKEVFLSQGKVLLKKLLKLDQ